MKFGKHSKAISIWAGIASATSFLAVLSDFVPGKYRPIANAIGGVLVAVSAMHASNSGPAAPPVE